MEFRDTVAARHSIRDFADAPVSREVLARVIDAARLAPSSANLQPWRFLVVQGEPRRRLGEVIAQSTIHLAEYMEMLGSQRYEAAVSWYSSLGNAPVLIMVSAPVTTVEFESLNRNLSLGAAMENLLLAATDEGLGACNVTFSHWVKDELAKELGIPDTDEIVSIIALGVASDVPPASPEVKPDDTVWIG